MSQGTRVHQLAMYVVFEAPLQMMADNPTATGKSRSVRGLLPKRPQYSTKRKYWMPKFQSTL